MAMQVIGAGWGRTGTESLRAALGILGFGPVHHMHAIRDDPRLLPDWQDFAAGRHRDYDRLYAGFSSAVDFPTAALWRALADHWPEARVVLTLRDPEAWYDSVAATVLELMAEREALTDAHQRAVLDFSDAFIGQGLFEGRGADRDHMLARFRAHAADVAATLPPERLLIYRVAEGWGPLCAFLDVPVPDAPFPHANTAESYRTGWDGERDGPG